MYQSRKGGRMERNITKFAGVCSVEVENDNLILGIYNIIQEDGDLLSFTILDVEKELIEKIKGASNYKRYKESRIFFEGVHNKNKNSFYINYLSSDPYTDAEEE
jgi:hypothetical protein